MKTVANVRKQSEKYDSPVSRAERRLSVQQRLRVLCDTHGVELVSAATGYTSGTLVQYLRVKEPPMIGESTISKAEKILSEL